jgi:3-polyprenyl-4-hydroxybenzoate decarboxylase
MARRLTVAAAALLALPAVTVWTPDASAFTTAKRLCVNSARKTLKQTLSTTRLQANSQYQSSLRACFSG